MHQVYLEYSRVNGSYRVEKATYKLGAPYLNAGAGCESQQGEHHRMDGMGNENYLKSTLHVSLVSNPREHLHEPGPMRPSSDS